MAETMLDILEDAIVHISGDDYATECLEELQARLSELILDLRAMYANSNGWTYDDAPKVLSNMRADIIHIASQVGDDKERGDK